MTNKHTLAIILVLIFIVVWMASSERVEVLEFQDDVDRTKVLRLLGELLLIALLLERSLEVFVTTWKGPASKRMERQLVPMRSKIADLLAKREKLASGTAQELEELEKQLAAARNELMVASRHLEDYKSKTQQWDSS